MRTIAKTPETQLAAFLCDVMGAVEANSYETLCLWEECHKHLGKSWLQNNCGLMEQIGTIDDKPVCLSLFTNVVDGHKVLFFDATSQVVDHRMVDAWLVANLPPSAFHGDRVNRTDAMNFHNLFPRRGLAAA